MSTDPLIEEFRAALQGQAALPKHERNIVLGHLARGVCPETSKRIVDRHDSKLVAPVIRRRDQVGAA